ncbi:MAG: glutathione S-transferase N-terminal domain-containing protein [Bacteriovoracaceae bacterium]
MKLELYYYEECPFCARALQKINRLGLTDKIELKNTRENPAFREEHLQKTGRATVPSLYIDGNPMFESEDIMRWLEENQNNI